MTSDVIWDIMSKCLQANKFPVTISFPTRVDATNWRKRAYRTMKKKGVAGLILRINDETNEVLIDREPVYTVKLADGTQMDLTECEQEQVLLNAKAAGVDVSRESLGEEWRPPETAVSRKAMEEALEKDRQERLSKGLPLVGTAHKQKDQQQPLAAHSSQTARHHKQKDQQQPLAAHSSQTARHHKQKDQQQ